MTRDFLTISPSGEAWTAVFNRLKGLPVWEEMAVDDAICLRSASRGENALERLENCEMDLVGARAGASGHAEVFSLEPRIRIRITPNTSQIAGERIILHELAHVFCYAAYPWTRGAYNWHNATFRHTERRVCICNWPMLTHAEILERVEERRASLGRTSVYDQGRVIVEMMTDALSLQRSLAAHPLMED